MGGAELWIASKKLVGDSEVWRRRVQQVRRAAKLLWEGLTNPAGRPNRSPVILPWGWAEV